MFKIPARSKMFVFSTVLAVVLATTSATSVFAASATAPSLVNHSLAALWGNQYRELQADRIIYNNFKSHHEELNSSATPAEIQQYLNQYAFALNSAEAIVLHSSPSSISKVNNRDQNTVRQQVALYLHMMRGLRAKLGGS